MKSRIFSTLISILTAASALACVSPIYDTKKMQAYDILRNAPDHQSDTKSIDNNKANIELWRKATGATCSTEEITEIVYKTPLDSLRRLSRPTNNKFTLWLLDPKNSHCLDFLLLAKEVETLRESMRDPWYYPTDDDNLHLRLNQLIDSAAMHHDGPLGSRYLLQSIRMLHSLKRYSEIIDLWNKYNASLPEDVLRRMTTGYVAGAYERQGDFDNAVSLYASIDDFEAIGLINTRIESSKFSLNAPNIFVVEIENLMNYYPNHPSIKSLLQSTIRSFEDDIKYYEWYDENYRLYKRTTTQTERELLLHLAQLAEEYATRTDIKEPGLWYYTAAYLNYLDGNDDKAIELNNKAAQARASKDVKECNEALRILLDFEVKPINRQQLLADLKILDRNMREELNSKSAHKSIDPYNVHSGYTINYWIDITRKACALASFRLQKSDPLLALQLCNFGNYSFLSFMPLEYWSYDLKNGEYINTIPIEQLRKRAVDFVEGNIFDFRNQFFTSLDGRPADIAAQYVDLIENPRDNLDRFLVSHGYNDKDYLYEHVGTIYLREFNYPQAVKWLSKVSPAYQKSTNIDIYMDLDPFAVLDSNVKIADNTDYKLRFAKRMLELQKKMSTATDPNEIAEAEIEFAVGLRNSVDRCWPLTAYCKGNVYRDVFSYFNSDILLFDEMQENNNTDAIYFSKLLIKEALSKITDPELAARMQYKFKNFKTVAKNYAGTEMATTVYSSCDKLIDYSLNNK